MTESNVETAFTREVATAGANALTIFGRETNSEPKRALGRQGTIVQSPTQVEETDLDQRGRHRVGLSLGFQVRQKRRHFLAIKEESD